MKQSSKKLTHKLVSSLVITALGFSGISVVQADVLVKVDSAGKPEMKFEDYNPPVGAEMLLSKKAPDSEFLEAIRKADKKLKEERLATLSPVEVGADLKWIATDIDAQVQPLGKYSDELYESVKTLRGRYQVPQQGKKLKSDVDFKERIAKGLVLKSLDRVESARDSLSIKVADLKDLSTRLSNLANEAASLNDVEAKCSYLGGQLSTELRRQSGELVSTTTFENKKVGGLFNLGWFDNPITKSRVKEITVKHENPIPTMRDVPTGEIENMGFRLSDLQGRTAELRDKIAEKVEEIRVAAEALDSANTAANNVMGMFREKYPNSEAIQKDLEIRSEVSGRIVSVQKIVDSTSFGDLSVKAKNQLQDLDLLIGRARGKQQSCMIAAQGVSDAREKAASTLENLESALETAASPSRSIGGDASSAETK